jgi:hypothetical protein
MKTSQRRIGFSKYKSFDEKRQTTRQKSYADIWVDPGDLAAPIFCKVLDISHEGARLMVQGEAVLPDTFFMCMATSKHAARVMWRSEREVGVVFQKPNNVPSTHWRRYAPTLKRLAPEFDASSDHPPLDVATLASQTLASPATGQQPLATADALEDDERKQLDSALARLVQCLDRMKS